MCYIYRMFVLYSIYQRDEKFYEIHNKTCFYINENDYVKQRLYVVFILFWLYCGKNGNDIRTNICLCAGNINPYNIKWRDCVKWCLRYQCVRTYIYALQYPKWIDPCTYIVHSISHYRIESVLHHIVRNTIIPSWLRDRRFLLASLILTVNNFILIISISVVDKGYTVSQMVKPLCV